MSISKVGCLPSCEIFLSIIIAGLYGTKTIIDQTEDLYHLNLPQDSGFASPEGSFTVKEITTAINSFSEEYRIPFSMHVAGYKYHEIAEKMDLPLGTVKSRIFFARQRLQEMLKDYK